MRRSAPPGAGRFSRFTTKATLRLVGGLIFLVLLAGNAGSQLDEPDLSGLLINGTRTHMGQDFYRRFCALWGDVKSGYPYNITIREIPDARWGSLVIVQINELQAYRKILGPRTLETEQEAKRAVAAARRYLLHLIRTNGNSDNDDMKGDGY